MDEATLLAQLKRIPNVGPAIARDLVKLGVGHPEQLATMDPDAMYDRLCELTGVRQDPCVWDTFAAVVAYAKDGQRRAWWEFTPERKKQWAEQGRR